VSAHFDPNRLYRLLVEQVNDYAIFALDTHGTVSTWNPGAERFKGYAASEIIGRSFTAFYTPEDVAAGRPERLLETATRTGRAADEGWRVRKDGTRFWANVTITALHDDSGALIGFAKITRDLTEQRANEERARRLLAEEAAHAATMEAHREMEALNARLQDQARELEAQTEEAQSLAEELEQANEQLQSTLAEAETAREEAHESDRFSRTILESMADPFAVLDAEWRYQFVNAPAIKMMASSGHDTATSILGQTLWELYPDIIGTEFERNMRHTATERVQTRFEAFYSRRGEWSALQCYPLPDGGIAIQWRDITDRKRSEESAHYLARASDILNRSLDYAETLNDVARLVVPDLADWCGIDIVDDTGTLHQVAVAHVELEKVERGRELSRKYPPPRDSDTGVYHVLRSGRAEVYPEVTDEMLAAAAMDEEHLRLTRELGIKSVMLVPLRVRDRALGVLSFVRSESERRYGPAEVALAEELAHRAAIAIENARLHEAAIEARRQAEEANRAKTDFLATMSHELRTPLNAISGYTSLLQLGIKGPLTDDQQEFLRRIDRSGRYLLSLIQDVLSFAKLETGHVEFTVSEIPVEPVLTEMESLLLPQIRDAGLTLDIAECSPSVRVVADAERLRQIMLNLLGNAVKFTPRGGCIRVECVEEASEVRIMVRDTGIGIPPDKRDAIFAPFVQLQREASGSQAGAGLGLAISRDLVRGMSGDLLVDSDIGRGSTFTVVLPRA
jgi:PAS domain S-box-containing protein